MVTLIPGSTAVSTTEVDLFTPVTVTKTYGCTIYVDPVGASDEFIFKQYVYDQTAAAYKLEKKHTVKGSQTLLSLIFNPVATSRYKVTGQKISGTDRTFNWERAEY